MSMVMETFSKRLPWQVMEDNPNDAEKVKQFFQEYARGGIEIRSFDPDFGLYGSAGNGVDFKVTTGIPSVNVSYKNSTVRTGDIISHLRNKGYEMGPYVNGFGETEDGKWQMAHRDWRKSLQGTLTMYEIGKNSNPGCRLFTHLGIDGVEKSGKALKEYENLVGTR